MGPVATNRTNRPRAPIAPTPRPWWEDTDRPTPRTTRPAHDAMAEIAATRETRRELEELASGLRPYGPASTAEEELADAFGDVIVE